MEKYSLLTSFIVHIGLPKERPHPFFSLLSLLRGLVSLTQGWRTSEGPSQDYNHKQPNPSTITKHPGTEGTQLHFCQPQTEFLVS